MYNECDSDITEVSLSNFYHKYIHGLMDDDLDYVGNSVAKYLSLLRLLIQAMPDVLLHDLDLMRRGWKIHLDRNGVEVPCIEPLKHKVQVDSTVLMAQQPPATLPVNPGTGAKQHAGNQHLPPAGYVRNKKEMEEAVGSRLMFEPYLMLGRPHIKCADLRMDPSAGHRKKLLKPHEKPATEENNAAAGDEQSAAHQVLEKNAVETPVECARDAHEENLQELPKITQLPPSCSVPSQALIEHPTTECPPCNQYPGGITDGCCPQQTDVDLECSRVPVYQPPDVASTLPSEVEEWSQEKGSHTEAYKRLDVQQTPPNNGYQGYQYHTEAEDHKERWHYSDVLPQFCVPDRTPVEQELQRRYSMACQEPLCRMGPPPKLAMTDPTPADKRYRKQKCPFVQRLQNNWVDAEFYSGLGIMYPPPHNADPRLQRADNGRHQSTEFMESMDIANIVANMMTPAQRQYWVTLQQMIQERNQIMDWKVKQAKNASTGPNMKPRTVEPKGTSPEKRVMPKSGQKENPSPKKPRRSLDSKISNSPEELMNESPSKKLSKSPNKRSKKYCQKPGSWSPGKTVNRSPGQSIIKSPEPPVNGSPNQGSKAQRGSFQKSAPLCAFCMKGGTTPEVYTSHVLRDGEGRVECPVLRSVVCKQCGQTGDDAHTTAHCPNKPELTNESACQAIQ